MTKPEVVIVNGYSHDSWAAIRCPDCRDICFIDRDQFEGKAPILCECDYHETHDLQTDAQQEQNDGLSTG